MLTEQFADLFEGRMDAYGEDDGGCWRLTAPFEPWYIPFEWHLSGHKSIGVYPMVYRADPWQTPEWFVKWGCVDFDVKTKGKPSWDYETEDEAHIAAVNLQKTLRHLGVASWIERTRSSGRHVWLFAASWTAASVMRRALLLSCSVAGVSVREVNPKQETLAEGQLGNYVRLPYPGALTDAPYYRQAMILHSGQAIAMERFVQDARATRAAPDVLEKIAARYVPPTRAHLRVEAASYDGSLDQILKMLNKQGKHVFLNGPDDGDRSRGLAYLAAQCFNSGLSPELAMVLVENLDTRLEKFVGRADRDRRLEDVVERAYT